MSRRTARPTVFFSFRSPFSWMALHVLKREIPDYLDHVEMVPFFEPDAVSAEELARRGGEFHYVAMSKAKHLYILNDTKRYAAKLGLNLHWPVDVDPWWELPHLAWIKARTLGCDAAFYDAVTVARWEHGMNICEPEVLEGVVRAAGLPITPLLTAPHEAPVREAGVNALMRVYENDVFGVPYFRLGHQKFWGLDRVNDFVAAYRGTGPAAPLSPPLAVSAAVGAFDHDTAGGCG
ncbi:MAG: DsbA family protein [Dermatophilaceae bacterium]